MLVRRKVSLHFGNDVVRDYDVKRTVAGVGEDPLGAEAEGFACRTFSVEKEVHVEVRVTVDLHGVYILFWMF